jgi:hypothetical protein
MDETKSVRLAALAGLAFFVLVIVSGPVLQSNTPNITDSATKIFNYYKNHAGNIKASAVVLSFGVAFVLVWLSGLWRMLRKAEGGTPGLTATAVAGAVIATALTITSSAINATAALQASNLGPSGTRVFYTLATFSTAGILFGLLVLIAATTVVAVQTGVLPRWLTLASVVLVAISVVGAFGLGYAKNWLQAVVGVGLTLDSLWILVVSVRLWRKPELATG